MGILDRIIDRGVNKQPVTPQNEENKETTNETLEEKPQEVAGQEVKQENADQSATQNEQKAGFFSKLSKAFEFKQEELKPLKEYKNARRLGKVSYILSVISSIMLCTICAFIGLTFALSIFGASTELSGLFSEDVNAMSFGLAGALGVFTAIMLSVVVLLIFAVLFFACFVPIHLTIRAKTKMVYPPALYSLNVLHNIGQIAGNFVYAILMIFGAVLVITNHGSPIIYGVFFAIGALMLATAIITIVDFVKCKKAYKTIGDTEKEELSEEYQNIKAHERRNRRKRDIKHNLWS